MTRQQFIERFRATAGGNGEGDPASGPLRGDADLNPDMLTRRPLTPAAVLVPIINRGPVMTVLLTRRTDTLPDHAGQISFPGGRIEADDASAEAAALRETEEEVGLDRRHVDVLGRLDDYVTGTGFAVTPVVGMIEPPFDLTPQADEVAEAFEVPLAFLLDPANHQRHERIINGRDRHFYAMPYHDYFIWGATAGMLINLYRRLNRP